MCVCRVRLAVHSTLLTIGSDFNLFVQPNPVDLIWLEYLSIGVEHAYNIDGLGWWGCKFYKATFCSHVVLGSGSGVSVLFAEFQTVGSDWLAGGPMKRKLLPKTWRSNRGKHSRSKRFCSSVPAASINQIHPVQVCYNNSFCVENPSAKPCRRPPMKLLLQATLPQMTGLLLYHLPFSVSLPLSPWIPFPEALLPVNVMPYRYSWELCRTGQPGTASQLHPSLRIWIAPTNKISAVKSQLLQISFQGWTRPKDFTLELIDGRIEAPLPALGISAQLLLTKFASDLATAQATDLRTRAEKSMQCNQVKRKSQEWSSKYLLSACKWSECTWGPFPWYFMIFYQCRLYFMIFDQSRLYISTSGSLPFALGLEFTKQTKLQHLSLKEPQSIFNSSEFAKAAEQMLLLPSQHTIEKAENNRSLGHPSE